MEGENSCEDFPRKHVLRFDWTTHGEGELASFVDAGPPYTIATLLAKFTQEGET